MQDYARFGAAIAQFWNSWWFFTTLGLGFAYLTLESGYKVFYTCLALSSEGLAYYDFLKVTRLEWG
jgi:hypothetical protein